MCPDKLGMIDVGYLQKILQRNTGEQLDNEEITVIMEGVNEVKDKGNKLSLKSLKEMLLTTEHTLLSNNYQ